MYFVAKPWKTYQMPEGVWNQLVRTKGDRIAHQIAAILLRKRLAGMAKAKAKEKRLAERAWKRGPQITPDNEIGAEIEFEMSAWSYQALHNDKEAAAEGGINNDDFMKWWLKRNEACKRATGMHANRIGWLPAQVEQSVGFFRALKSERMALATSILQDAAAEGKTKILT